MNDLVSEEKYATKPEAWLPKKNVTLTFKKLIKALWKSTFHDGNGEKLVGLLFRVHEKMVIEMDWDCFLSSKEVLGDSYGFQWIESMRMRNIFEHVLTQFCSDGDCREMFMDLEKILLRIEHVENQSVIHEYIIRGKTLQITFKGNLKQDVTVGEPSIDEQVQQLTEAFDKIIEEDVSNSTSTGGQGPVEKLLVSVDDLHVEDAYITKPIDWIPKKGDKKFQESAKEIWKDIMCYKYSVSDGILSNLHKLNRNVKFEFDWDSILSLPKELYWNYTDPALEDDLTSATENAMRFIKSSPKWKAIVCTHVFPKFCEDSDAKVAFSQLRRIVVTFKHSPDPKKDAGKSARDFMFVPVQFKVEQTTLSIILSMNLPLLLNATCVCGYPDPAIEIDSLYRAFDEYQIETGNLITSTITSPNALSIASSLKQELDVNLDYPTQPGEWLPKNCYLSFIRDAKKIWKERMYNKYSVSESVLDALYQKNTNCVIEIDWQSILTLPRDIVWNFSDPNSNKDMKSATENTMRFLSVTPRLKYLFGNAVHEFCKDSDCNDLFRKVRKMVYHVKFDKDLTKFEGLGSNTYGFISHDFELKDTTLHATLCANLPLVMNIHATAGVPDTRREALFITRAFDNAKSTSSVFQTPNEVSGEAVSSYVVASQKEELETRPHFLTKASEWLPTNYSMEHLKMAKNIWRTRMYRPPGIHNPEDGVLVQLYKLNPNATFEIDWASIYALPKDKFWNYWRPNQTEDMKNSVDNALIFLSQQQRFKYLFEATIPKFMEDSDCKKLFLGLRKLVYHVRHELNSEYKDSEQNFTPHKYQIQDKTMHITLACNIVFVMNDPATCGIPSTDSEIQAMVRAFDSSHPSATVQNSSFNQNNSNPNFKYATDPVGFLPSNCSIEFKKSARALWSGRMYSEYDTQNSKLLPILYNVNKNMALEIDWNSILNLSGEWNYFGKQEMKTASDNAMIFLKRTSRFKMLFNVFEEYCKDSNCNTQFQKLNRLVYHLAHDPNRSKRCRSDYEGFLPHEFTVVGTTLHVSFIANLPLALTEAHEIYCPASENEIKELSKALGVSCASSSSESSSGGSGISRLFSKFNIGDIERNLGKLKGLVNQIERIIK